MENFNRKGVCNYFLIGAPVVYTDIMMYSYKNRNAFTEIINKCMEERERIT